MICRILKLFAPCSKMAWGYWTLYSINGSRNQSIQPLQLVKDISLTQGSSSSLVERTPIMLEQSTYISHNNEMCQCVAQKTSKRKIDDKDTSLLHCFHEFATNRHRVIQHSDKAHSKSAYERRMLLSDPNWSQRTVADRNTLPKKGAPTFFTRYDINNPGSAKIDDVDALSTCQYDPPKCVTCLLRTSDISVSKQLTQCPHLRTRPPHMADSEEQKHLQYPPPRFESCHLSSRSAFMNTINKKLSVLSVFKNSTSKKDSLSVLPDNKLDEAEEVYHTNKTMPKKQKQACQVDSGSHPNLQFNNKHCQSDPELLQSYSAAGMPWPCHKASHIDFNGTLTTTCKDDGIISMLPHQISCPTSLVGASRSGLGDEICTANVAEDVKENGEDRHLSNVPCSLSIDRSVQCNMATNMQIYGLAPSPVVAICRRNGDVVLSSNRKNCDSGSIIYKQKFLSADYARGHCRSKSAGRLASIASQSATGTSNKSVSSSSRSSRSPIRVENDKYGSGCSSTSATTATKKESKSKIRIS